MPATAALPETGVKAGLGLRLDRHELAGGLGDIGLLLPISIALITVNGLSATAVFGIAGLAYIGTALYFRLPFPVQPLKAFAAIAIATKVSSETIAAGTLLMAASMGLLAISGLASWLTERMPLVLIRGIQASIALLLTKAAFVLADKGNWKGLPAIDPTVSIGIALAVCALLLLLRGRSLPGTLIVIAGGATIGFLVDGGLPDLTLGPAPVYLSIPGGHAFVVALTTLVIAQIPLTFGNSIAATDNVMREYFGDRAERVRPRAIATSIALWNTISGLIAGLPICHGAGGATAHYKLGARNAAATITTGAILLVLALAFGSSLPALLHLLIPGALAGMLLYVAVQHAGLALKNDHFGDTAIAVMMGVVTMWSANLAIGFGFGIAALLVRAGWRRAFSRSAVATHSG